jgi:hypothetical protein
VCTGELASDPCSSHDEERSVRPAEGKVLGDLEQRSALRPIAIGYVSEQLLIGRRVPRELANGLASVARAEGFTLARLHVERLDSSPCAFGAVVADIYRGARAVVIPSLHHVATLEGGLIATRYLACLTGVRVLDAAGAMAARRTLERTER